MKTFDGIADAADAARALVISGGTGLAATIAEKLAPLGRTGTSPVDLIVGFAEAIYANAGAATAEAKDVAAGCAIVAETYGFHQMNVEARGSKIARTLDGKAVSNPPEPKADWLDTKDTAAEETPNV